jgi:hypothetical protein
LTNEAGHAIKGGNHSKCLLLFLNRVSRIICSIQVVPNSFGLMVPPRKKFNLIIIGQMGRAFDTRDVRLGRNTRHESVHVIAKTLAKYPFRAILVSEGTGAEMDGLGAFAF